jgi:multidrug efflux pump subunit AcrA (membrane-fusion protein)
MVETGEIAAVRAQDLRPPQDWQSSLIIVDLAPEGTVVAVGDTVARFDDSALARPLAESRTACATSPPSGRGRSPASPASGRRWSMRWPWPN